MFKKISFLLVLIVIVMFTNTVNAQEYQDKINEHGMWIPNEFVNKTKNGSTKYQQMTLIVRESDGRFLYCIQPGKSIKENSIFKGYEGKVTSFIGDSEWIRIKKLAYFGYGYKDENYDHTDIKWYVITQFMIWQTSNLGYDIYFTDRLNGNRITKYTDEINELNELVEKYYKLPSLGTFNLDGFVNEEESFNDSNNVLNTFQIVGNPLIEAKIENNNLKVKYGNEQITNEKLLLQRTYGRFKNEVLTYIQNDSQALLLPGKLDTDEINLNYSVKYGTLDIIKEDYDHNTYFNDATLQNAKYGIYNSNNELIEEKLTDENGHISFDSKLGRGNYYFKELEPSKGYLLDNQKYDFTVDSNNLKHEYAVKEKIISESYEITKLLSDDTNNIIKYESGIEFGVYDSKDNIINTYTTDNYGKFNFNLVYGDYTLKQHSAYDGYEKIKDYKISVIDNNKKNILTFVDNLIKYRVNLNVKEKTTLVNISNIQFELYDENDNKICDTFNNCIYSTDTNGNILFPGYFKEGNYYIKLISNDNFKYDFESDIIQFSVNSNTSYKKINDYRLIELYYLLSRNEQEPKEEVQEQPKEESKDDLQEQIKEESEEDLKEQLKEESEEQIQQLNPVSKIDDVVDNQDEIESIVDLEKDNVDNYITVDVPNTLKNDFDLVYLFMCGIYIIKKLL